MGLFKKKNNYVMLFDMDSMQYHYVTLNNEVVDFNNLDLFSKKRLLNANKELLTDRRLLNNEIEKCKINKRKDYLKSIGFTCECKIYDGNDDEKFSSDVDGFLDDLLSEDNVLIGIYKTNLPFTDISNIFEKGLFTNKDSLKDLISYYPSNKTIKKELCHVDTNGSILIRIPDSVLNINDELFIKTDNGYLLNKKYIVGYVPVKDNFISKIIFNPDYLMEINGEKKKAI